MVRQLYRRGALVSLGMWPAILITRLTLWETNDDSYNYEYHLMNDIALSHYQYYAATSNLTWLATKGWPVVQVRFCSPREMDPR